MKCVVYYSLNGHCEKLVADEKESFRIETQKPLPKNKVWQMISLGYKATKKKSIPIVPLDVSKYDEITIYTPVWSGNVALPTLEFLKTTNLEGKVINFVLNFGGKVGSQGKSEEHLKTLLGDKLGQITLVSNQDTK